MNFCSFNYNVEIRPYLNIENRNTLVSVDISTSTRVFLIGAGGGNRTRVISLGS